MELEDSNEKQGLRGLDINIFNKISSSVQVPVTSTSTKLEQPATEQITEQVAEPVAAEQDSPSAKRHTFTLSEQAKSTSAKQDTLAMLPTKDLPSMPPTSQDEGHGHGVSINFMIVTPRVPTLGE